MSHSPFPPAAEEPAAAAPQLPPAVMTELVEVAEREGCELLHAEFKGGVLRLILDRDEGVSLTDCERVSKQASAVLDVLEFGRGAYTLEVSSPGLDRQLYSPRDYRRFVGHLVRVTFRDQEQEGTRRTVVGRLRAFEAEGGGTLELTEEEPPKLPGKAPHPKKAQAARRQGAEPRTYRIPLAVVQLARLEIEL